MLSFAFVSLFTAIAVAASCSPSARAAEIDVYLLAGQSNAGGHGYVSKEFAYFSQFKDPGLLEIGQTQWLKVQPNALLFAQGGTVPSKERPLFWERRTDGWLPMRAGFDTVDSTGKIIRNNPFGVEVTFAARWSERHPDRKVAIVKYTRGATSVRTDWDPVAGRMYDTKNPGVQGHCYAGMMKAVNESLAVLREKGEQPTVRGVMWIQGESDAGMVPADYTERLRTLFQAMRSDLGNDKLPVAVGELLQINPNFTSLRTAQNAYVASDPDSVLVSSAGLTADHTFGGKLHIDTASILTFGQRFADALDHVARSTTQAVEP